MLLASNNDAIPDCVNILTVLFSGRFSGRPASRRRIGRASSGVADRVSSLRAAAGCGPSSPTRAVEDS